jgi:hypothetical protein
MTRRGPSPHHTQVPLLCAIVAALITLTGCERGDNLDLGRFMVELARGALAAWLL